MTQQTASGLSLALPRWEDEKVCIQNRRQAVAKRAAALAAVSVMPAGPAAAAGRAALAEAQKRVLIILMTFALLLSSSPLKGATNAELPWRIVLLDSGTVMLPGNILQNNGFIQAVRNGTSRQVEFFLEGMEDLRVSNFDSSEFAAYLSKKYETTRVDLLVPTGPVALDFVEQHGAEIWRGAPIVFCSIRPETLEGRKLGPNITGQTIQFDVGRTLDLAARLHPKASRMAIVSGTDAYDQKWVPLIDKELLRHPGLSPLYLTNQTLPNLLEELRHLPRDTFVYCASIMRDASGHSYLSSEIIGQITSASSAPVYSHFDTFLGGGIVGGSMAGFTRQGRRGGELALRVLIGEKPGAIPVQPPPTPEQIVDERQLQKWKIDRKLLPPGVTIQFHEPGLWEAHHRTAIAIAVAGLAQSALVVALIMNRRRRKHSDGALRESEARFRHIADSAPVFIWMSDTLRNCNYVNRGWLEFTGRSLEQELGNGWREMIHPDDREACSRNSTSAVEKRMPLDLTFRVRRHDGAYRWLLSRGEPRFGTDGEFLGYIGMAMDITERKLVEEARENLAHASRLTAVGQLTAMIAHEISQPLGAILANAEAGKRLLDSTPPDLEEIREVLVDIRNDDLRARESIRGIRALAHKGQMEMAVLNLNDLAAEVVKLVSIDAQRHEVNIQEEFEPKLILIRGDRVRLQQVLLNLVMNAMDAMAQMTENSRRLTVQTSRNGEKHAEIAVLDTGRGIPADVLPRLFDSFYTTKKEGMGLGLAIARWIIESHNGRIKAENNPLGGAVFRIELPLAMATQAQAENSR